MLVAQQLRALLPETWSIETAGGGAGRDIALVVTAPDGRSASIAVEAKTLIDARIVPLIAEQLSTPGNQAGLVAARYLSPRTRAALKERGLSYADQTGNVRVVIDEPGLAIIATGADRDPFRGPDRPTTTLRGAPAARVVRALVDRRPPWRMRELASYATTSLGSTARTVDLLDREALVRRDDSGSIADADWPELLRRWADDYDLLKRRRVTRALVPRGVESIAGALRGTPISYAISGSLASRRVAPEADTRLGLIYAQNTEDVLSALRAQESGGATNVLVIEPTDDTPFLRTVNDEDVRYAAFSQVAVDLLAGPGRAPEEGDALLRWMTENEDRWRA